MKSMYAVLMCVLLLLCSGCTQKVNDSADIKAIKDNLDAFNKAEMANDVAWFTSKCYLENSVRMPPNRGPLVGKEEIGKYLQGAYDSYNSIRQDSAADDVWSSGDLAVARGKFTWSATPKAAGLGPVNEQGKWAAVYQRQPDGSWRCAFDIWNSDMPATGATADGAEEQALYQIERDWAAADVKRDVAAENKILAKEFVGTFGNRMVNKAQRLALVKSRPERIESAENAEMTALIFGNTGIVHGLYVEKSTTNGKDSSGKWRYTDVFTKRDSRWQCVTSYAAKE
jgi:ketosteroid isomerase-like protein